MKKFYFSLIAAILTCCALSAQSISSFTIDPPNPTESDSVRVYVRCSFPSSGCDGVAYLDGISGYQINAGAIHCMGSLTVLCSDDDTLFLPPLAAGSYSLYFLLSTGISAGCIPNIVPIVFDSTHFVVSSSTGMESPATVSPLKIFPNPSCNAFRVAGTQDAISIIEIYATDGRLVHSQKPEPGETMVQHALSNGIYTLVAVAGKEKHLARLVILQ